MLKYKIENGSLLISFTTKRGGKRIGGHLRFSHYKINQAVRSLQSLMRLHDMKRNYKEFDFTIEGPLYFNVVPVGMRTGNAWIEATYMFSMMIRNKKNFNKYCQAFQQYVRHVERSVEFSKNVEILFRSGVRSGKSEIVTKHMGSIHNVGRAFDFLDDGKLIHVELENSNVNK